MPVPPTINRMSSGAHTYALLAATHLSSTLHTHAREWCEIFSDEWMLLCADGLDDPNNNVATPITEEPKDLAQSVDFDARELDWSEDATLYVLVDPDQLDEATGDVFRRSLRVVLKRLTDEVVFPFDDLDPDERGGWLVQCLNDGEIKNPTRKYAADSGAKQDQRDLDSF